MKLQPHEFILPYQIKPLQDTFYVGDTIHVSAHFSNNIYDRSNGRHYTLENCNLRPKMGISDIGDTLPYRQDEHFELIPINNLEFGQVRANTYRLTFQYDANKYHMEYKVVLQDTGKFSMFQVPSIIDLNNCDPKERCHTIEGSIYANMENPDSSNIYMLQNSPDSYYNDKVLQKPQQRFHDHAGFAFYVKPR